MYQSLVYLVLIRLYCEVKSQWVQVKFPPINLTLAHLLSCLVCAWHHARLSCTLVNKTNKAVRFKINACANGKNSTSSPSHASAWCLSHRMGVGFCGLCLDFFYISQELVMFYRILYEMWMAKRNLGFWWGCEFAYSVWPLGFRLSNEWSGVKVKK